MQLLPNRYKLTISDGTHSMGALVATQLSEVVSNQVNFKVQIDNN